MEQTNAGRLLAVGVVGEENRSAPDSDVRFIKQEPDVEITDDVRCQHCDVCGRDYIGACLIHGPSLVRNGTVKLEKPERLNNETDNALDRTQTRRSVCG